MYTYSVVDLCLKKFFTVLWNLRAFYSLQIEHYACLSAFSAIVFYISYSLLFWLWSQFIY